MTTKDQTNGLHKVTKLESSEDWDAHFREMNNWLIINDLFEIIEEHHEQPSSSIAEETINHWKKCQRKALAAIDGRLGETARSFVTNLTTYHAVYTKLKKQFKPQGDGAFMEYSNQLMNLSLSSHNNVEEYTSEFKRLQGKLASLSPHAILKECWVIQWYLQGLSSAYDVFKTSLSHAGNILPTDDEGKNGLSFEVVILKVMTEEKSINFRDNQASLAMTATADLETPTVEIRQSLRDRILPPPQPIPGMTDHVMAATRYCTFCKILGHCELNCFKKDPTNASKKRPRGSGGKRDNKKEGSSSKKPKQERDNNADITMVAFAHPADVALAAGSNKEARSLLAGSWGVDTMASCHLTHSKEAFIQYTAGDISKTVTGMGGTVCRSRGKGTVRLRCKNQNGDIKNVDITNVYHIPECGVNLLSFAHLKDKGVDFAFKGRDFQLKINGQGFIAGRHGNVWFLQVE